MRWLARLLRLQAGPTPRRLSSFELAQFEPGTVVDLKSLADQHNEAVLLLQSLESRTVDLVETMRGISGRMDVLEGNPNGTTGDPIELHLVRAMEERLVRLETNHG